MPEIQSKEGNFNIGKKAVRIIIRRRSYVLRSLVRSVTKYNSYDGGRWENTYLDLSGGFVVTERSRIATANLNPQEQMKYQKERNMCERFASFGFQIEHLGEVSGISSPDTRVVGNTVKKGLVKVNGVYADLKSTSSASNMEHYASKAVNKQGADIIMFEFTRRNQAIEQKIKTLSKKGYHGFYYFVGEPGYGSF